MDQNNIKYLHQQYLNDTLTEAESADWERLLNDPAQEEVLKSLMAMTWQEMRSADLKDMSADQADLMERFITAQDQGRTIRLWPRIAMVAAALALIFVGVYFFKSVLQPEVKNIVARNDVSPGSNKATIRLADGKTISLSGSKSGVVVDRSKIAYNDGSLVQHSIGVQTISTPRGGTYQITLSDGTRVWLNAASSLTYVAGLNEKGERSVKLNGEAYFEVAKDKIHPFVVESRGQRVEVLGTHFNISSYEDESVVKTTLLEGSVKINDLILKPNEQSLLSGNDLKVRQVDTENEIAWKNGEFIFKEDDLRATMRKIARWYDVEIIYDASAPAVLTPGGWVSRSKNISAVLKIMEATGKVHFKVEGRRITVTK
ncbi:FecR protein [Pedobacter steynii]|uniref:FecR protein n=1 Tax=Pedobacter steynii TaxID=430522 RepID=A0A1G9PFB9_9SPHI|nr:FecR domain-containing protein [Pedobacter steynii]NQX39013.1 FecR family protein [Pedobacter steynii]SDL96907.1 FecR protein [Pedobacter steynii]